MTVFKVLDCKKEKSGKKYRFLVNPKDNPEYFITTTQQSFLPEEDLEEDAGDEPAEPAPADETPAESEVTV